MKPSSADRRTQALLRFDATVELGQLAVGALLWPACRLLLKRLPEIRAPVIQLGSAGVLAAGRAWFLTRALGAP